MVQRKLEKQHFSNVVRCVRMANADRVGQIRRATYATLERLGVKKDLTKASKGRIPRGSDQFDFGSILTWLAKITPANNSAIAQVVAIHATAVVRSAG